MCQKFASTAIHLMPHSNICVGIQICCNIVHYHDFIKLYYLSQNTFTPQIKAAELMVTYWTSFLLMNWSKIIDWALLRGFLTWASVSIWQERSSVEALFIEESSTYDPEYVKRDGRGIYGCWIYNHMYARDEVGNLNDKNGIVFSHQFLRPAKCWLKSEHNITLFWFFLREFFV